jgi:hypothetical protein
MKAKKLLVILIVALVVISVTIILLPLEEFEQSRDSLNSNALSDGSYYTYYVCADRNSYAKLQSNSNNYTFPQGVIKLTVLSNKVKIKEKFYCGEQDTINYSENEIISIDNSFVQFFLNSLPIQIGSFYKLPEGLVGTAMRDPQNYQIIYMTSNASLSSLQAKIGITSPTEIQVNNVNESMVPVSDKFHLSIEKNQFDYDHAGNTNILVRAFITGNTSFLYQVFNTKGLQYSIGFSLLLVATNVALHPIDYTHYLSEYAFYIPPIWIISFAVFYALLRSAKKRKQLRKEKMKTEGRISECPC